MAYIEVFSRFAGELLLASTCVMQTIKSGGIKKQENREMDGATIYSEGRAARRDGSRRDDCPYGRAEDVFARSRWLEGWRDSDTILSALRGRADEAEIEAEIEATAQDRARFCHHCPSCPVRFERAQALADHVALSHPVSRAISGGNAATPMRRLAPDVSSLPLFSLFGCR